MIKQAADQLQTSLRDHSSDFAAVKAQIEELHKKGELTESQSLGDSMRLWSACLCSRNCQSVQLSAR
jgi:hypothetical protein